MEPSKKIKVSVIVKYVADKQDKELADKNGDGYLALSQVKKALDAISLKSDEEDREKVLHLLDAAKRSNEVMASALIDIDREDLFDDKVMTIDAIDEIINKIKSI